MLTKKSFARHARWLRAALFVLAPLAYLGGVWLLLRYDPNVATQIAIDRAGATAAAARFAAARGVDVQGWESYCSVQANNDLHFYHRLKRSQAQTSAESTPPSGAQLEQLAPELVLELLFRAPDNSETIVVGLDRTGRPLGFRRLIARARDVPAQGASAQPSAAASATPEANQAPAATTEQEAASRKTVEAALRARLDAAGIAFNPAELTPREDPEGRNGPLRYRYTWPSAAHPELKLVSTLAARGSVLMSDELRPELDHEFARQQLHSHSKLRIASAVLYGLTVFLVLVFGIYRFAQRVRQQEISYSRIAVLSAVFAAVMTLYVLLTDVAVFPNAQIPENPVSKWVIMFSAAMAYVVIGLFIGLAYGSGEGDIRESYPGKLTSLDALLTGRIFSRNVARALLAGCAVGGWSLLLMSLVAVPWNARPSYGEEFSPIDLWLGHLPTLAAFTSWPMDTILVVIIGLLLPLPFLRRRWSNPRVIVPALAVFVWIASAGPYMGFRPWAAVLVMALVRMAAVLAAFFLFDCLTVIAALAFPVFVSFAVAMIAQPAATIRSSGLIALAVAGVALLVAAIFTRKGKLYSEDELRPVYAKYIAERMSMQAEVSAAREAQQRLLPEHLPRDAHFRIAAHCAPAYEVGGDFYDLFELEPGKLGVLVADGGGKGLGAALSIAFAKGYLMPKIANGTGGDDSPTELLLGLQERLTEMLDDEAGAGLAYAVIDAADGSLRYARVGAHPLVAIERGGRNGANGELETPAERPIVFHSRRDGSAAIKIIEGRTEIAPGDALALFTDGIDRDWTSGKQTRAGELKKILADGDKSGDLQEALNDSIGRSAKRARRRGSEDDLTAVVVKFVPPST